MQRAFAAALVVALVVPAGAAAQTRPPPALSAAAAASYDVVGDRFVRQINADVPVQPASLAKMLVALLVAQHLTPDEQISISYRAATTRPDNIRWPQGAIVTADDLLHAMMMESSNGAAVAFADHIAGSVQTFTQMMDERAKSLGATNTHIVEPSGLDAPGQRSTARDLALIAAAVVRDPWLSKVVRTKVRDIPWPGGKYTLHTLNGWIVRFDGAIGVKNGYTTQAGNCLAAAAERHGRTVVTIVLNARRWYADSAALMLDAFPRSQAGAVARANPSAVAAADVVASPVAGRSPRSPRSMAAILAFSAGAMTVVARRRQVVRRRAARRRARVTSNLPG